MADGNFSAKIVSGIASSLDGPLEAELRKGMEEDMFASNEPAKMRGPLEIETARCMAAARKLTREHDCTDARRCFLSGEMRERMRGGLVTSSHLLSANKQDNAVSKKQVFASG